mmetsp:Transcript_2073/g.4752  ORF Transcript_2073/g.4752 Transcript_2073/m.4752 type:complete len:557 (-) Transcript_2073:252-1922(-)
MHSGSNSGGGGGSKSSSGNASGSAWAQERILYLSEMFAALPIEEIQKQVAEVEAERVGDARAMEMLVDRCISASGKFDAKEETDPAKTSSDSDVYEIISLVPMSFETTNDSKKMELVEEDRKIDTIDLTQDVDRDSVPESKHERKETENFPSQNEQGHKTLSMETENERLDSMVATVLQLNSNRGETAVSAWKLLIRIGENVVSAPDNPKFRRVPLNDKVSRKLSFLEGSLEICDAIGFKLINAGEGKRYLLLSDDDMNVEAITYAVGVFKAAMISQSSSSSEHLSKRSLPNTKVTSTTPTLKAGEGIYRRSKVSKDLREKILRQKRKIQAEKSYRKPRLTKDRMADLVLQRLNGIKKPATGTVRKGNVTDFNKVRNMQSQIEQIRASKNRKWRNTRAGRKRVYTVSDLQDMAKQRQKAVSNFGNKHELDKIGKEALKFTNEFRAKHGKPPLSWHQALCDIGRVHSKDMGDGKVPFSHTGFKERVAQYPFHHYAAAENLAMNAGIPEAQVARVAVNGWIDSPGHRKNLLSQQTLCGIGVYRNHRGQYYLTQLFART